MYPLFLREKRQAMHVAIQMPHAACWGLCPQSPLNAEFYSAATRSLNAFLLPQRSQRFVCVCLSEQNKHKVSVRRLQDFRHSV